MAGIKHPGKRISSVARAEYLLARGDPRAAAACARRVLRHDPEQIGCLEVLARSLWQLGLYDSLLVTIATLTRLNPYEPGYHELRGAALQALGRLGEAVKAFARATPKSDIAGASVQELRNWQETVIADMIRDDEVFRIAYARDPESACRERGFEFLTECRPGDTWLAKSEAQTALYSRPS